MRARALIFRVVFFGIIFGLGYYIYRQIQLFVDMPAPLRYGMMALIAFVFANILAFPLYFMSIRQQSMTALQKFFLHLSHYSLAYLNFIVPLILLRDLVTVLLLFVIHGNVDFLYGAPAFWATFALPVALTLAGHLNIRRGPIVFHHEIRDERLPREFRGLKMAQVSDLHISMFLVEGFVDRLLKQFQRLKADMVILTGDIVDGLMKDHEEDIEKLKGLHSPLGVFYVPGNHEYYWGVGGILEKLNSLGFEVLLNQAKPIRRGEAEILVCGIPDTAAAHFSGEENIDFDKLKAHYRERQYRILLSHQPNQADVAVKHSLHAQFSGHTHAGQFFPWNLLIGFFQKYSKGAYRVEEGGHWLNLYVNQGTAYWGPALRLGTRCELTLITFS